jgi:hypothetical protein
LFRSVSQDLAQVMPVKAQTLRLVCQPEALNLRRL